MDNLEFAIKMEVDGEIFYREQAEKYKNTNLYNVFMLLARDERKHADVLRRNRDKLSSDSDLMDTDVFEQYRNVFEGSDHFKSEIKPEPDQIDVYLLAAEKERESINLYKDMLAKATTDLDKRLFEFLIREEEIHFKILDEMVDHVIKPQEWVEDAEFGIREDY